MARRASELQEEVDTLQGTIDDVYEQVQGALDPKLSREEVIEKLQEIEGSLAPEEPEQEGTEEQD
jgi:hypothetical protein